MKYKHVENYLNYCQYQKRLTGKTLKAYRIDLNQFYTYMQFKNLKNKKDISVYIQQLHTTYKPRTVKRKIAAIKAFYTYLEKQDFLKENPFHKIDYRFKEPIRLPKTITLHELNHLYQSLYAYSKQTSNRVITRDIAILELLICLPICLYVITPLGTSLGYVIASPIQMLESVSPVLVAFIVSGLYELFVAFGLHQALGAIFVMDLFTAGVNYSLLPAQFASQFLIVAVTDLAISFKSKNKKTKLELI